MGKVIDITEILKQRKENTGQSKAKEKAFGHSTENASETVLEFENFRESRAQMDRRETKRTILSEFVSACVIVPQKGLFKVALHDLSDKGLAFDIPFSSGDFNLGEEIAMRVYLNRQTYFPFVVRLTNGRFIEEDGVIRQGAEFVKDTVNEEALFHFVRFIECVCTSLKRDSGDLMTSNLNGL